MFCFILFFFNFCFSKFLSCFLIFCFSKRWFFCFLISVFQRLCFAFHFLISVFQNYCFLIWFYYFCFLELCLFLKIFFLLFVVWFLFWSEITEQIIGLCVTFEVQCVKYTRMRVSQYLNTISYHIKADSVIVRENTA